MLCIMMNNKDLYDSIWFDLIISMLVAQDYENWTYQVLISMLVAQDYG